MNHFVQNGRFKMLTGILSVQFLKNAVFFVKEPTEYVKYG